VAGFAFLVTAIGTGLVQLATAGLSPRGWTVYAELTLLGWLVVFITGIWYRLFAFLIWLHFHGRGDGTRVRTATEVVNQPVAWVSLGLLVPGIGALAVGTALGAAGVARAGAVGILLAAGLIAGQYGRMFVGR
jgi:hypothetical protein